MMERIFHPGQRWISDAEPELGLGSVREVSSRTVTVRYAASEESREYAQDNAPLRRVRFHEGDTVKDHQNSPLLVEKVEERDGLLYYEGGSKTGTRRLCETDLSDAITFNEPKERLLASQVDPPEAFDLRVAALNLQHGRRNSRVRGFVGGRIELIPHQLSIAAEVAGRLAPRVLLADEVGLGKTIEAGLILHRLILTGRAQRVLILAPDSLVHQWLVEMLRRFNLWFHVFDEERCAAIEARNPEANPFLDDQLILAGMSLFAERNHRVEQARAAGWDMLVVDEAHHLGWSEVRASPEYEVVEALGRAAPGLMLLTATPEQLGMASHFARLRLLDPARFHDLDEFRRETGHYLEVARQAEALQAGQELDDLLDRHGTGRVMFRNTRATIAGFPDRVAHLCPLDPGPDAAVRRETLAAEFAAATYPNPAIDFVADFSDDPRTEWLVSLLLDLSDQKLLLICRTRTRACALEAALRARLNLKMALFHEGLSLVQRDRHAAWFAEEDGARLLICSEIGSEGRNFQFAHHLVMFDLPLDPELLEQRIGRLDRIGQTSRIHIHVPFIKGSAQEVLARWYHEGLNAFLTNLHGGHELLERFGSRVREVARSFHEGAGGSDEAVAILLSDTAKARAEIASRLEQGRDRLLELNSFRPKAAARLIDEISERDADADLEAFMISVFDRFTVPVEELAPRTYRLGSAGALIETFPGLPASGVTVTADRRRALSREDIQFLTSDHPLVSGALDLLLGAERGNCSFGFWADPGSHGLYLETIHVLECVAPARLHVDRFLPPTPLRILVNQEGEDETAKLPPASLAGRLKPGVPTMLTETRVRTELLPELMARSRDLARSAAPDIVGRARAELTAQLDHEIERLRQLQKVNRSVRNEEVDLLLREKEALDHYVAGAHLRLDAVRLILRGPGSRS